MAEKEIYKSGEFVPTEAMAKRIDTNFANSVESTRVRKTIAEVNAGSVLLPSIVGKSYRLVSAAAIAIGGAVGAVTTVDILGTQSTSPVKLVAYAQASLTEDAQLNSGDSGAAILAAGASYRVCDAGSNVTVDITGSDATTATHIDFILQYVIE